MHWRRGDGLAEFPDGVTARGAKHLGELTNQVAAGDRAVQLFIVQRNDCRVLRPAEDVDPVYAEALRAAAAAGVEVLAYGCEVDRFGVEIGHRMAVELTR